MLALSESAGSDLREDFSDKELSFTAVLPLRFWRALLILSNVLSRKVDTRLEGLGVVRSETVESIDSEDER